MSVTSPPNNTDKTNNDHAVEQIVAPLKQGAAYYHAKSLSDWNQSPVKPEKDTDGEFKFQMAPVQLAQIFSSPVELGGTYGKSKDGVRLVTSGWGRPRSSNTVSDGVINTDRKHAGLDFIGDYNSKILAAAPGKVTAVFVHLSKTGKEAWGGNIFCRTGTRKNPTTIQRIYIDDLGFPRNSNGDYFTIEKNGNSIKIGPITATTPNYLGFGGLMIQIQHTGAYAGYTTEYCHLSKVLVDVDHVVSAGEQIGEMGASGGNRGDFRADPQNIHLHWQIRFQGKRVNPTYLVPHNWIGHEFIALDGTIINSGGTAVSSLDPSTRMTGGVSSVYGQAVGRIQGAERSTKMRNRSGADHKTAQGQHAQQIAQHMNTSVGAMYEAIAKFQSDPIMVKDPTLFDFEKGYWTDNKTPTAGEGL